MSATARSHEPLDPSARAAEELLAGTAAPEPDVEPTTGDGEPVIGNAAGTEYATRGARGRTSGRPNLRMVSPLRAERASRGVFSLVVTGLLLVGMVTILVINTSLAQGAFTVSELQAQQAVLSQQEQALAELVAAAAAPESLEEQARGLGMVPSETPVFLSVPSGKVLGKPKAAPGGTTSAPRLLTPADATASEAVDNASVGTDLPVAPGVGYDPAAADAAAAQAAAANLAAVDAQLEKVAAKTDGRKPGRNAAAGNAKKDGKRGVASENSLWGDTTLIDVTSKVSSGDSGLVAVPVD